jgi:7-cyano-7-deazaguanine reductase
MARWDIFMAGRKTLSPASRLATANSLDLSKLFVTLLLLAMPSKKTPSNAANKTQKKFRLLGRADTSFPSAPSKEILDVFPNRSPHRSYWITFECSEFTSVCPVTAQPDFAKFTIRYIPERLCVETKSLKYYLASFRHTPAFNEEITNRILEDLVAVAQPREMIVEGEFSPRGGIAVSVLAKHPDPGAESEIPF